MERKLYSVRLYGKLAKKYGTDIIEVYGIHLRDVFAGLVSRFGDVFKSIILNGQWYITKGSRESSILKETDSFISEDLVEFPIIENELHIFPAVTGAGGRGIGQIILGIVLIIVAIAITIIYPPAGPAVAGTAFGVSYSATAASLALAGVLSVAGGVVSMLTSTPSMGDYGSTNVDQRPSFLYNGVVNNTEQGVPVPLVYGRHLTGSTVISAGMDVEQI